MQRTKKWTFVAQEAQRLASLGLTAAEIAQKVGVHRATVGRWIEGGLLAVEQPAHRSVPAVQASQSPREWAAAVRANYQLDATDEQLMTLAEAALEVSLSRSASAAVRMNATRTYQGLVRQLNLVARVAAQEVEQPAAEPQRRQHTPVSRPSGPDPRTLLMAVK